MNDYEAGRAAGRWEGFVCGLVVCIVLIIIVLAVVSVPAKWDEELARFGREQQETHEASFTGSWISVRGGQLSFIKARGGLNDG